MRDIVIVVSYIYMAIALQTIAKKTNTENPWFAWIPILNFILMIKIAEKPIWWILLYFVPIVDIVIIIIVYIEILKKRNYSPWWVILFFIPIVNYFAMGMVAWKDKE